MTNTKPARLFELGEVVGHDGRRAEVTFLPASFKHYKMLIRYTDGIGGTAFVWATELHEAPPLPDHVQQAARQLVAEGWLTDPHAAIFGRDES